MILPNLIVPGAAKSGTSSLHEYLNQHPRIQMSKIKEPHFFSRDYVYRNGLRFYEGIYSDGTFDYYGESSTSYFGNVEALTRIKQNLEDIRFIIILRNPIKRTISHYRWLVSINKEFRSFRKAIMSDIHRPVNFQKPSPGGVYKGYYSFSMYENQLSALYDIFDKDSVLVITTEDLIDNPLRTLNNCFKFLNLEELEETTSSKYNVTGDTNGPLRIKRSSIKRFVTKFPYSIYPTIERIRGALVNKGKLLNITGDDEKWLSDLMLPDNRRLKGIHPELLLRWNLL